MVDEWGTWYNVEPGTNPGFLYQQNTLRDALVAAISLNIFNQNCERVKMANIAQTVNVLQAMILTKNEKMVLTPTYHVYDMYKNHHDATLLPTVLRTSDYEMNGKKIPALNASVSKDKDHRINITIANVDPVNGKEISTLIRGMNISKISEAKVLTAQNFTAHNTFENPNEVKPTDFKGAKISKNELTINIPAKSVLFLQLE
jgi:alpha-L-arabinofuranosidase